MNVNEYEKAALRTARINDFNNRELLENGVLGLNGEAGEVSDILKKYKFQGHPLIEEEIALELGDIAWYLVLTGYAIGYSLEEILEMNIKKLKKRYPEGFEEEKSVNR